MYVHAAPLEPPDNVTWIATHPGQVTFDWNPVAHKCLGVYYNIIASNCGSCPTATTNNTITCTDVPTDGYMCTFILQTVVCVNITGRKSDPVYVQQKGIVFFNC